MSSYHPLTTADLAAQEAVHSQLPPFVLEEHRVEHLAGQATAAQVGLAGYIERLVDFFRAAGINTPGAWVNERYTPTEHDYMVLRGEGTFHNPFVVVIQSCDQHVYAINVNRVWDRFQVPHPTKRLAPDQCFVAAGPCAFPADEKKNHTRAWLPPNGRWLAGPAGHVIDSGTWTVQSLCATHQTTLLPPGTTPSSSNRVAWRMVNPDPSSAPVQHVVTDDYRHQYRWTTPGALALDRTLPSGWGPVSEVAWRCEIFSPALHSSHTDGQVVHPVTFRVVFSTSYSADLERARAALEMQLHAAAGAGPDQPAIRSLGRHQFVARARREGRVRAFA
ncbi:hypothetical protein JCM8208_007538 [Rhodotorula glutinis]